MSGDKPVRRRSASFAMMLSCFGCALFGGAKLEAQADPAVGPQAEMIPQHDVVVQGGGMPSDQPVTYSIRIYKEPDRIKLKGNLSSEEDYKTLLGMVKASFPAAGLSDRVKVTESAADSEVKIGGLSFALKLLGYLENGKASVDDNGLSLEGAASTAVVLNEVKNILANDRPTGVPLRNIRIAPPRKSWTASVSEDGTLKITGILPNERKKQAIAAAASKIFPEVADHTSVDKSAPAIWIAAAHQALTILQALDRGSVEITDQTIQLKGAAPNELALKRIDGLAAELPAGFSVHSEVTAPTRPGLAVITQDEIVH